jgi:NAD+ kinase
MKITLHGIGVQQEFLPQIGFLFKVLKEKNIDINLTESLIKSLKKNGFPIKGLKSINQNDTIKESDFVISIGGDGTLLDSVCQSGKMRSPSWVSTLVGWVFWRLWQKKTLKTALGN